MKNYIRLIIIVIIFGIFCSACSKNSNIIDEEREKYNLIGLYFLSEESEDTFFKPYIQLKENGEYNFNSGLVRNYIPIMGKYELKDDILTLFNKDSKKYIFKLKDESLIFDSKNSPEISIKNLKNKDENDLKSAIRNLNEKDVFKKMSIELPYYKDIIDIDITTQMTPKVEKINIDEQEDIKYTINLLKEIGYTPLNKKEDIKGWQYYIKIRYKTADKEEKLIALSFIDADMAKFNDDYYTTTAYDSLKILNLFTKYEEK